MTNVAFLPKIADVVAQMHDDETEFVIEVLLPLAEIADSRIEAVRWTVGNWSEFVDLAHEVVQAIFATPAHCITVAMPNKEFAEAFIDPFFAVLCKLAPNLGDCVLARNTSAISFRFGPEDIRSVRVFSRQATPLPGVCTNTMFVVFANSIAQATPAAPGV